MAARREERGRDGGEGLRERSRSGAAGTGIAPGELHVTAAPRGPRFVPGLSPAWLETSAAGDPSPAGGKSRITAFPGQSPSRCTYNITDRPGISSGAARPPGSGSSRRTRGSPLSAGSEAKAGGTLTILSPCTSLEQSLGFQRHRSIHTFQTGTPGRALLRRSLG